MSADTAAQAAPSASAAGDDLQIPKHRLDEALSDVRRLREEMAIKDQLYLTERQRSQQSQPQRPQLSSPEDLGLDPTTYKAVAALSQQIAGQMVAQEKATLNAQFAGLFERTEQAELTATHGQAAVKHRAEIKRRQEEHFRATGGFLPAETALKLIKADENDSQLERLKSQIAELQAGGGQQQAAQAPSQQIQRGLPNSAATGGLAGGGTAGGAGSGKKSFAQMNIEEMEAALAQQFGQGNVL
jgi:hypothetical protein